MSARGTILDQLIARALHAVISPWTPDEVKRAIADQESPEHGAALYEEFLSDPRCDDYEVFVTMRVVPKDKPRIVQLSD